MTSHETVQWYLSQHPGAAGQFAAHLASGQRYGQAFFNALPREDQVSLLGTLYDTFHKDQPFDCYLAIANILTV